MSRFGNKLYLVALLVGISIMGPAPPVQASTLEIDYSIDGGARQIGASTTTGSGTTTLHWSSSDVGAAGLFSVDMTIATSNSPGSATQAKITQSNNTVNTLYGSGTHTLTIYVSSDGFSSPSSPPPLVLGNASSITQDSGSTQVTFTSYSDTSNTLFGMSGSTVTSTSVSYSASGQNGTGKGASSALFTTNGQHPYSLTNEGDYTLSGGTSLTVVSGNTTVTPTPAPPAAVLALTGLPCLGFAVWLRRRNK
jgi:hypothetical protein